MDPDEIRFQPGTFLVRASAANTLLASRAAARSGPADGSGPPPDHGVPTTPTSGEAPTPPEPTAPSAPSPTLDGLTVRIRDVPASKAREVVKVAVLPLSAASAEVRIDVTIRADGGLAGIPRDTLTLVVLEGLRQLGLTDLDVVEE